MPFYSIIGAAISSLGSGPELGTISDINPLAPDATLPSAQSQRIICWSGWCGETMFARDFQTWTPDAWAKLDRFCSLLPEGGGRTVGSLLHDERPTPMTRLCLRPHPRHILSDPQSCLAFLKRHPHPGIELLLDPAGFLARSMLPRAEEHILRALDSLAGHEKVPAIIVSNIAPAPEDDDLLQPARVDQGLLPAAIMRLIAARSTDKPIILLGPDPVAQARFLSAGG